MEYFLCFSCFIIFDDVCFFHLLTKKIITSCVTWATENVLLFCFFPFITLLLKILLLPIISLRFLFLLYAIIGFPWKAFFSLGLICNKCECSSMTFFLFGKVLFNVSTSGILGLFAIFCFEVNKASLVTSDIWLNWSVRINSL